MLIALIPISVIGVFAYFNTQRALDQQIEVQITNTLTRQTNKIDTLISQDLQRIDLFAVQVPVRFLINSYYQDQSKVTQQKLNELLKTIQQDNRGFRRLHVLNTEGIVIGSSDERFVGKDYRNTEVFQRGLVGTDVSFFFKDIDGILGHYLVERMILEGKLIGVALIESQADSYALLTRDYTDTGKTGETFLVGHTDANEEVYLTPLRFNANAALTQYSPSTTNPPHDYRDHTVLQMTRELPVTKWMLGVKIDEAEIYAPVSRLRDLTLIIVGVTTIAVILLALYFARFFTAPIIALTNKTRLIMEGDLNQKIDVKSSDEIGALGTAFNQMVTNLKQKIEQLHSEQVKLQASINSLSVGYIMVDRDRNIAVINQTAKQAFCALESSQFATIEACTLVHIADQLKTVVDLPALIDQCFTQKKPLLVHELAFNNRYLKIFITPIITIGVIGAVILIDDITEPKLLERSKDEFFSIASHELRTPLTAIRGNTSMIKDFYGDKLTDPALKEMVEDIHKSSIRLIGIVNDFLDTSRLEQGKMEFKKVPFNITDLINEVIKEDQSIAAQKQLALTFHTETVNALQDVFADRDKTKQVLINLIDNALKFTEHGAITLSTQAGNGFIKVLISDTGRGISDANKNLLFRKFQQANTSLLTRDTTKGTGLGLYISKLIMEGMGGHVQLESSQEGSGSTFSLTFPVAMKDQIPVEPSSSSTIDIATGITQKDPTQTS